jgi:predicted ATPase
MDLYLQAGDRAAALRQYQACVQVLQKELGVAPSVTTTALFERIHQGAEAEIQEGTIPLTRAAALPGQGKSSASLSLTPIQLPSFLKQATSPEKTTSVFVARERELAELESTLDTARAGQGQILFVIGGAGRGKTMLLQEFARRAQAADPELLVFNGYCNAHTGTGDPYLPFREALTLLAGEVEAKWAGGLITSGHARRLWEAMPLTLPALVEHAPDLIDTFVPDKALQERAATFAPPEAAWFSQLTSMISDGQRANLEQKRILTQYTALLKAIARQRPLLLILEDLHWVDASSSDLLFHLSRTVGDSRILMVGTYRPEEVSLSQPMSGAEHGTRHPLAGIVSELKRRHGDIWLDLREMTPAEGRHFVEAYLDTQPNRLGPAFREELFRHTGGHALFTVELLREMVDRGNIRRDEAGSWVAGEIINWHKLPAKVEGVIERRINRLEAELQAVLTIACVEGESFTAEVVAQAQQLNERSLIQRLSQELDKQHRLVTAQTLEWLAPGEQRLSIYRFRHHLFQHYLYRRLDETERAYLHEEVGMVLEALYGEQTEKIALQLAHHFEIAGLTHKAVVYLLLAGQHATRLSAHQEAIVHLTKGLTLLETLAETPERNQQELALQIALGIALTATKGYGAAELEQAFNRAWALYRLGSSQSSTLEAEEATQLFQILYGLCFYYHTRAKLRLAREVVEQMLELAQRQRDSFLPMPAHWAMGFILYWMGEFASAQTHFEQSLALYDPQNYHSHALLFGQDLGVTCFAFTAWNLWALGYPDQALSRMREALTLATTLAHPYSLVLALNSSAQLQLRCGEWQTSLEQIDTVIKLSNQHGFLYWQVVGGINRGRVLIEQGQLEEGIDLMRQGLAVWRPLETHIAQPYSLASLAKAYGKAGEVEEGLNLVTEALTAVEQTAESFWQADLYRLKGELLSMQGNVEGEVESNFLQAITIARKQSARSLELRAVMSLSRLWHRQGKNEAARLMLAEIYNWFTEGFDTLDLQEAKALLEELRGE